MFKWLKQLFCNHEYRVAMYQSPIQRKQRNALMAFAECTKCGKHDYFARWLGKTQ